MGNPPDSKLGIIVALMEAGQIPQVIGTPLLTMFGDGQGQGNPLTNNNQQRRARGARGGVHP